MKENLTEIVFILDRSGSMSGLVNDTIGGFNSLIESQKKEDGDAFVTTVLFDHMYEILHNGVDLKEIQPLTNKEYFPRGMTALLDAIGKTINTVGERLNNTEESEKPSKVIFVISTDGQENSSKEFNQKQIKEMIEKQTNVYNWKFLFLGANIDAIATASNYGITYASNYTASAQGVASHYEGVSKAVSSVRGGDGIQVNWNSEIV